MHFADAHIVHVFSLKEPLLFFRRIKAERKGAALRKYFDRAPVQQNIQFFCAAERQSEGRVVCIGKFALTAHMQDAVRNVRKYAFSSA